MENKAAIKLEYLDIYKSLDFFNESIRLQYTNFIYKFQHDGLILKDIIFRLKKEEPIEYIFNKAIFHENIFFVDKRCLIPRVETQEIVDKAVQFILSNPNKYNIIDIGTGSGCIIISIIKELEELNINIDHYKFIGLDISINALEIANINKKELSPYSNLEFINKDFRDYDFTIYPNLIITSNLPYIPNTETLQKSVIDFEPTIALFGGEKGSELNDELKNITKELTNLKEMYMEGYEGKIESIIAHRDNSPL